MKKIHLLIFASIVCIPNNSNIYACSNSYKSRNAFYNYETDQYNNVTQSDLDDVDRFINDFLLGNTTPITTYYAPYNNFINSTVNNNDRKLSYDVHNNKNSTFSYQDSTNNNKIHNKQISISSNNDKLNNPTSNNRGVIRNYTYKILPSVQKQYNNITTIKQNNSNRALLYNQTSNISNNQHNHNINSKIETNNDLTNSEMKSILTDSEINRLINDNKTLNNTVPNYDQQDGMKELEKIFTKDEIDKLFPNYVGTTQTIFIKDTNKNKEVTSNYGSFMNSSVDNTNKPQTKIIKIPMNNSKVNQNKSGIINNNKKLSRSFLKIDTNVNSVQYDACLTDRNEEKSSKTIINSHSPKPKIDIRKAIIKISNNSKKKRPIKLLKKKVLLKKVATNTINTNWENGITQDEVTLFFDNIQNPNALENAKMQIYSLLGDVAPSFGNTDRIRLIFDVIKYNNSKAEKHIYNYEKPLALAGTFIDYYLNNIDLYNNSIEQFNTNCIEEAANIIPYNEEDYSFAIEVFYYNSFTSVINKVVKGVNLIEEFKNNKIEEENVNIIPLNLDKGKRQDWFTTTFQLFDYALQYSNKNDAIRNTNFAKFTNYLKNKSKHRNINEEIQFIPTLKSFVKLNKDDFNTNEIRSALDALYSEENSDIGCYGIMGSILMFRIFPELKTIFSSNQFGLNDSIIDMSNKFHFSTNQSLAKQFNNQAYQLLDIAYYDNGKKLFNNTDYLIMITNGLTRDKVINDRKYISRYNMENTIDPNKSIGDVGNKLELYELIGVQLYSNKNVNYISIDKSKLENAINSQSTLGKICINKKLQPMQALYKRISQNSIV